MTRTGVGIPSFPTHKHPVLRSLVHISHRRRRFRLARGRASKPLPDELVPDDHMTASYSPCLTLPLDRPAPSQSGQRGSRAQERRTRCLCIGKATILEKDGPSEGRHSAFPCARQRADLVADLKRSAPVGAQGRQSAFPPRALSMGEGATARANVPASGRPPAPKENAMPDAPQPLRARVALALRTARAGIRRRLPGSGR